MVECQDKWFVLDMQSITCLLMPRTFDLTMCKLAAHLKVFLAVCFLAWLINSGLFIFKIITFLLLFSSYKHIVTNNTVSLTSKVCENVNSSDVFLCSSLLSHVLQMLHKGSLRPLRGSYTHNWCPGFPQPRGGPGSSLPGVFIKDY